MFDDDVISFAHGDGLRAPDSAVVAAGIASLLDSVTFPLERYNFLERYEPLDESIRATMLAEGYPDDHVGSMCVDSGTTKLFVSFLSAVCDRGDTVLTAPTFYHGVIGWCDLLGLDLAVARTDRRTAFKLTYETLEDAHLRVARERGRPPRAVVVFNPTQCGAIYTRQELTEVAAYCDRFDVHVIEDNIFARTRFDFTSTVPHLAEDPIVGDRVVTVDGCSKADGLANVRIGWATGPAVVIGRMEAIKAATTVGLPHVSLVMADTALRTGDAARLLDAIECRARADAVIRAVDDLNDGLGHEPGEGFTVACPPAAGHSVFVDVGLSVRRRWPVSHLASSVELSAFWLDRAAVAVSPLYSSALDGHECRLNFAALHYRPPVPERGEPTVVDRRPHIVHAISVGDSSSALELVHRCETMRSRPVEPTRTHRVIQDGIVERIGGALQPRSLNHV